MKFGNKGFIKIYFHHDLSISGLTVKLKVYGPQRKLSISGTQTINRVTWFWKRLIEYWKNSSCIQCSFGSCFWSCIESLCWLWCSSCCWISAWIGWPLDVVYHKWSSPMRRLYLLSWNWWPRFLPGKEFICIRVNCWVLESGWISTQWTRG